MSRKHQAKLSAFELEHAGTNGRCRRNLGPLSFRGDLMERAGFDLQLTGAFKEHANVCVVDQQLTRWTNPVTMDFDRPYETI